MDDTSIVNLYWARSDRAIAETAEKYGRYCRVIAYNILANTEDTDECVNDTYLGAWNSMPTHRPESLATYLGKITRRLSLMRVRDRQRLKRGSGEIALALDELAECIPDGHDTEGEIERQELEGAIGRFVSLLPENERDIFVSRYWFLAPVAEIAKKFGFSESKVSTSLFRTRRKLKNYLQEEGLF